MAGPFVNQIWHKKVSQILTRPPLNLLGLKAYFHMSLWMSILVGGNFFQYFVQVLLHIADSESWLNSEFDDG